MCVDDGIDKLKKSTKDGVPEDVAKDGEGDLQKLHDKMVKRIEDLLAAKSKEINDRLRSQKNNAFGS